MLTGFINLIDYRVFCGRWVRKIFRRAWLKKLDITKSPKMGQKIGTFSVRMVFKSKMEQLVKFMYNLQTSAKWVKVESVRISISDQKENILSVDLSMTAKTLYE